MKVDLSALLKDCLITKTKIAEVISDLTIYSIRPEELIKLLKNKN